jgi:hypothetical protein
MGGRVLSKIPRLRSAAVLAGLVGCAALGACDLVLGIPDRTLDPHLVCADGACACGPGFADCDGKLANGCEAALQEDQANCGACGHDCQNGTCAAGACACHAKFADCDGKPENGCEASIVTDAANCGACGHDCLGAPCEGGHCQPIQLGMHKFVNTVQIAGGSLYLGVCLEDSPVLRMPLAGGAATPAATVAGAVASGVCAYSLAIAGDTLFWNETDHTGATSIVTNPLGQVTTPTLIAADAAAYLMAATPAFAYWNDGKAMALERVAATGGTVEMLYPMQVQALATDDANAYFSDGSGVFAVPHTGTAVTTLSPTEAVFAIAVSGSTLYLGGNPGVFSVPVTGGPAKTLSKTGAPGGLVVDATGIYFSDYGSDTINSMPLEGGAATVLASGQMLSTGPIASDALAVYYIANSQLFKIAK